MFNYQTLYNNFFKREDVEKAQKAFGRVSAPYFQRKYKITYGEAKILSDKINAENEFLCKKSE